MCICEVYPAQCSQMCICNVYPAQCSQMCICDIYPAQCSQMCICDIYPAQCSQMCICNIYPAQCSQMCICDVYPAQFILVNTAGALRLPITVHTGLLAGRKTSTCLQRVQQVIKVFSVGYGVLVVDGRVNVEVPVVWQRALHLHGTPSGPGRIRVTLPTLQIEHAFMGISIRKYDKII